MKGLEGAKLGRYELLCHIAQGGMSEIYLGFDRRVRRRVAVKVLYGSDEAFVRRFEREAVAIGTLSHAGAMIGTPEYMAPEQSNNINDYRSDIYALGIILYQMLTGHVPFTGDTPVAVTLKHLQTLPTPPRQLNSDIPQSIENV